ncbi:hypothetical protein ONE63_000064 [Megalurothrips usitatus]|uniref:Partial AB-hydrolase lipase domain-containing protein n=1 Tax=Megalurothrips usitatus TaxID=439358 RepID=A0AAV7Y276_9NEOP|nr:hypothetical protein ONE63_000064 [Megalurothrips usitatus]
MRTPCCALTLLLVWAPWAAGQDAATAQGRQLLEPLLEPLEPGVQAAAEFLTVPGKLLGAITPYTSPLNNALRKALAQNAATQFTSDIVSGLSDVFRALQNVTLPMPPPIRPDTEAPQFGFLAEGHDVTTSDGYILSLFRVRSAQCDAYRAVVVIPPAFFVNAASFMFLKNESLVHRLVRRCFDVWLTSCRGDLFGRRHVTLSDTDQKFWDFTPAEWGVYDLPVQLEFVSKATGSTRLRLVGLDTAGTALFFMNHAHGQRYQRLLASCYLFGPFGYLSHLDATLYLLLAKRRDLLTAIGAFALHDELAFMNPVVHATLYNLCGRFSPLTCKYLILLLEGQSDEVDETTFPYMFRNFFDSTSITAFDYLVNLVGKPKYMAFYDYGAEDNLRRYGQKSAPEVHLNATTVPCAFFALGTSAVVRPEDTLDTYNALSESARRHYEVLPGFNGLSPMFPRHPDLAYNGVIDLLEKDLEQYP